MKRIVYMLLFMLLLPFVHKVHASNLVIQVNEEATVFDNRSGSLEQVGTLSAGQTFEVTKDYGPNWWQIRWGGNYGYVDKRYTTVVPSKTYQNTVPSIVKVKDYIVATKATPVYDNTGNKLVQFATISEGVRFPIYSKMGSWYGIAVNGRLGFVHSNFVNEEKGQDNTNPSTKPVEKPTPTPPTPPTTPPSKPNGYLEALENAVLYDLRREQPMSIATLLKGQQLEIANVIDEMYVQVRWGNTFLYVEKSKIKFVNTPSFKNSGNDNAVKNQYFIPISGNNEIYDRTANKLQPFAKLDVNRRYPILRKEQNWYVTTIGGREGYIHSSKVALDRGVPVMMYHHFLKENELGRFKNVSTTMTDTQFANEMKYLKDKKYETVSTADLLRFMRNEITLPAYSIVLTFDDGLLSTREYAYPILKNYGFQATQFLITYRNEYSPAEQLFNYNDLQALSKQDMDYMKDVFTYESHTYNLHDMIGNKGKMLLIPYHEVVEDLKRSLTFIPNATAFAYPFGQYNANIIYAVKEAGFTMAFSTKPGYNNPHDDIYQIKRLYSDQQTSLAQFKKMVSPFAQ
ncbi:Poly-beta-1,6-N-acetyl-D-glucosamine N-deacetylase [Lysinibacillus sphaericus]|uniref:Poly-beta-1,6-N-acetyl-D-glucosamine N-deacetylase n=1 Tax=Lysinibacillus sphaericus TaxID=1421 RepID=A0A2S5CXS0_LYSSH|nr:polysaccharide deacetylase family protein [Lysinibacillus sphaericus]POZ55590.1 Poly-beta-1,6-N-acetyl-D-glucosamine N-deacetylase [Lysinibacillus sphaericus]